MRDWRPLGISVVSGKSMYERGGTPMPIVSQIVCDGCHAVKKDTNHWYTLVIGNDREACLRPMACTPSNLLQIGASGVVHYLCGRLCAIEALDRWMERVTICAAAEHRGE